MCTIIGVLSMLMTLLTGSPVQMLVGLLTMATFVLAGMGVRERSIAAAVLIFLTYLLDKCLGWMFAGVANPVVGVLSLMLLLANVRATVMSRRWENSRTPEDVREMPERSTVTFFDRMANVVPGKVWPAGQYVFYPLVAVMIALTLLGGVGMMMARRQLQKDAGDEPVMHTELPAK